jgi:hypothetical protein
VADVDQKLQRILQQVQRLPKANLFLTKKEIKELPNILWDDEEVVDLVPGFYSGGNGILVATHKRLIFVDKGMVYGLKVEDFPLDKVTSIQYQTGLLLASITIFASGNKAVIDNVDKTLARTFAEGVRARIATPAKPVTTTTAQPTAAPTAAPAKWEDLVAEIERYAELKERGLLTDEEFSAKKKQLLGI